MRKLDKKVAAIAGAGVLVLGVGTAYAYWTSNGTGSGTAGTTAGAADIANLVSGNLTTELFPGQGPQSFDFTVTNPGAQQIYVTDVSAYVTVTPAAGNDSALDTDGCDSSDYAIDGVASTSAGTLAKLENWVPVEVTTGTPVTKSTTLQFVNKSDANQDDCKDAAVTVHYIAS